MQEKITQLEVKKKQSKKLPKKLPSKEMKLFCQDPSPRVKVKIEKFFGRKRFTRSSILPTKIPPKRHQKQARLVYSIHQNDE